MQDARWENAREYFPITRNCIYLNHASIGPLPLPVREAVEGFMDRWSERDLSSEQHLDFSEDLRERAARLIGARPDEIAFTSNTSSGPLLAAVEIPFRPGDTILIPENEFPANVYPWLQLGKSGVRVKFVPAEHGIVTEERLMEAADARTRVIAVSHVSFLSGWRVDLEKLGKFCREKDILLFVDAMQSAGAVRIDLKRDRADMLCFAGMKWLLAPPGCGILYIRGETLGKLEGKMIGWRGVVRRGLADLVDYHLSPFGGARRYDGGSPNTLGHVGLNASLRLFESFDGMALYERIAALTGHAVRGLRSRGLEVLTPEESFRRAGIVSFKLENAEGRIQDLARRRIVIACRNGLARVSPHFYNTFSEIDSLLECLA
jgi:cysteine desulfurase/selenocysteine lyase